MADSLIPVYLTIDDQGRVGADFTGHIHALGLDLDAVQLPFAEPFTEDRVRFLRPNGDAAAEVRGGYDQADGVGTATLRATTVGPGYKIASLRLTASEDPVVIPGIRVFIDPRPGFLPIDRPLLDDRGESILSPVGAMVLVAGAQPLAGSGWVRADGASVLRTAFPRLFELIGVTEGSVDATHFNLPNPPAVGTGKWAIRTS